ncbi:hypothetical protein SKAU_G00350070 [Synaphobranchus kaupii]|uniref:Uncharacterized protein n=1 Tax=Synaphobranchus kaupii TaxID=118154 RepID=A0A9Q1EKD5_SYNKA|nr:hypothetical protein SKAU_G00350070 [Synaphobranchus kaupii]
MRPTIRPGGEPAPGFLSGADQGSRWGRPEGPTGTVHLRPVHMINSTLDGLSLDLGHLGAAGAGLGAEDCNLSP